jgi:hypothetical protein
MNWWEQIALSIVASLLQGLIKKPGSVAVADHVIQLIRDDASTVLLGLNPAAPPPPGWCACAK